MNPLSRPEGEFRSAQHEGPQIIPSRRRALVILAATLAGTVLTANLGAWQLRRAAQKIALQDALEARAKLPPIPQPELATTPEQAAAQHYRPVRLRGRWVADRTVFLENRQMDTRVGFYVVTPLQLDEPHEAVLIQRGWVPRDQLDRTKLPPVPTPAGVVEVDGFIAPPPGRLFDFGGGELGPIRQNLELVEFAAETGLRLAPVSVQQADAPGAAASASGAQGAQGALGDGLLRHWPHPAIDVQRNYGYAFQWFAMATLMTGLYVWFQLLRPWLRRRAA